MLKCHEIAMIEQFIKQSSDTTRGFDTHFFHRKGNFKNGTYAKHNEQTSDKSGSPFVQTNGKVFAVKISQRNDQGFSFVIQEHLGDNIGVVDLVTLTFPNNNTTFLIPPSSILAANNGSEVSINTPRQLAIKGTSGQGEDVNFVLVTLGDPI